MIHDLEGTSEEVGTLTRFRAVLNGALATLIVVGAAPSLAWAQSTLYSVSASDDRLRAINPLTGATLSSLAVTLAGKTILKFTGLATHPATGQLWALARTAGAPPCQPGLPSGPIPELVTIDPATGVATSKGSTGDCFAGLAFKTDGTLFAVTGDGAIVPETLYTLNTSTATRTFVKTLGNGGDGEAIGFSPTNGLLYHASGNDTIGSPPLVQIFESIDPANFAAPPVNIPRSPVSPSADYVEALALVYAGANVFLLTDGAAPGDVPPALFTITIGGVISRVGSMDHPAKGLAFAGSAAAGPLAAAVLPSSRSVQVGAAATAFATLINAGPTLATACGITPITGLAATFGYQTTDPATNQVNGTPNTPVNIAAGAFQTYVFSLTPSAPIASTDVQFSFSCSNASAAASISGVNTLLFTASATPVPDIVALAATLNGDGIVNVPGATGTGVFAVATVNVGATRDITASADTGSAVLPVNLFLCQTNPSTGACLAPLASTVSLTIIAGTTPTFGIFVAGSGNIAFDAANNRVFVRFKDAGAVTRGSTSVAVRTQ